MKYNFIFTTTNRFEKILLPVLNLKAIIYFLIFCSIIFIIQTPCSAQQLSTPKFKKISVEHGLSHPSVTCMLKDRYGFMWIGTRDGLNRYDSYQFRIFKHLADDSTSISNNTISCLLEDQEGFLWIGTVGGGLNRYDPVKDSFKRFLNHPDRPQSLASNSVSSIMEDRQGNLWIGTIGGGLSRYDKQTELFLHY